MRVAVLAASLAGAGCWTSTATPTAPAAPAAPARPAAELERGGRAIAPITCTDVGIVLRGPVDGGADAGPSKERTIAQACAEDAWSRAVIDCVGRGKKDCLEQLTVAQRRSYDGRLARWRSRFAIDPPDGGGDDDSDVP